MESNYQESKQIMELVHAFEEKYNTSKEQVHSFDTTQLDTDVTVKTMKQCYRIVKENLNKIRPNFDKEKMEQNIDTLSKDVRHALTQLCKIKGEYFALNDQIINKDTNQFKIEQVRKSVSKQDAVLETFADVEEAILKNTEATRV